MTEQLTRQYIQNMGGTIQASEETIYLPNRVLAGELMDVVGDDALTRAYLHGDWTPVSSALTSHFGDTQETLRFLETIRNIGANGKPMHLVDDARQMLLRLGPDDTQPNLMIPNRP